MTDIKYRDYPSQAELRETFDYHPDGYLVWKIKTANCVKIGTRVGSLTEKGYYRMRVNNRTVYSHVMIWIYHNGNIPLGYFVDHIINAKAGGSDHIENLRLVTSVENSRKQITRKNFSIYGVGISKNGNQYLVRIGDRKKVNICVYLKSHSEALELSIQKYQELGYDKFHYQRNIDLLEQHKIDELRKAA